MNGKRTTLGTITSHSAGNLNRARRLDVVYRPLAELQLDANNPRVHSRRQIGQLQRSIETFGFNVPVPVDANQGDRGARPGDGVPGARLE